MLKKETTTSEETREGEEVTIDQPENDFEKAGLIKDGRIKAALFKLITPENVINAGSPSLWGLISTFNIQIRPINDVNLYIMTKYGPGYYRLYPDMCVESIMSATKIIEDIEQTDVKKDGE
jgi:hypothetical protein